MKFAQFALLAIISLSACASKPHVTWQQLGNRDDNTYVQRFIVEGSRNIKHLCFNQFARQMTPVNPADTLHEIVPGYYYIASSRFGKTNDTIQIDIVTRGRFNARCYAIDGLHAINKKGKLTAVGYTREPVDQSRKQWSNSTFDLMPYGDSIFAINKVLDCPRQLSPFDIIPRLKNVVPAEKGTTPSFARTTERLIAHDNYEFYRIILAGNSISIEGASEAALKIARHTLARLFDINGGTLPNAVIEDYPDFHYRGLMIDIARNFQPLDSLLRMVDLMADYRFNKFHFHFCDDEAWRLEIPTMPELTEYGARRGYTLDEDNFLAQIFTGNGDPDNKASSSNGYYTRADFIRLLQHCDSLGIEVIPEIESPGHARAAIKAMQYFYRKNDHVRYFLSENNDNSSYTSAQAFHDNVMNPAIDGPHDFMSSVISDIHNMYGDAGLELKSFHIGGDEVPKGAWSGSPTAKAYIEHRGFDGEHGLLSYWVSELSKVLSDRGIKMNGWQEIAIGHSKAFNDTISPLVGGVNCWSTLRTKGIPEEAVRNGFPVILSNVNHFYMDQVYNNHPEEPGLNWGGSVDEFAAFNGYADLLCQNQRGAKGEIIGISGHLFSETLRSPAMMQLYLLPKMLGLAERAWNRNESWTKAEFNKIIGSRELPRFSAVGLNFHLRQPGITFSNGTATMNSPYPEAVIRYTTDGTSPTADSPIYEKPFSVSSDVNQIRARIFYLGKESLSTILFINN